MPRRTSIRLEAAFWDALAEIAKQLDTTRGSLVAGIASSIEANEPLAKSVRIACLLYFQKGAFPFPYERVAPRPAKLTPEEKLERKRTANRERMRRIREGTWKPRARKSPES